MNTVRCPEFPRKAAPCVDLTRYGLKVIWVDALSHAAKVVELQADRDLPAMVLVAPAVSINLLPFILERAVPAWVKRANPLPAASALVNGDVLLEADLARS